MTGSNCGASASGNFERVALTGFMGAGKTTVGPLLARSWGWPFYDLDRLVEIRSGQPAGVLLTRCGEADFRRREVEALADVVGSRPWVLALGGGTVATPEARRMLRALGAVVVWLAVDYETAAARIPAGTRPLWGADEGANRALFVRRAALYRSVADCRVDATGTPDNVARAIAAALGERRVG